MVYKRLRFLVPAETYIKGLSNAEQARVDVDTDAMLRSKEVLVKTKQLRGPIRELIIGNHRLTYFALEGTLYIVRGFRKKTAKTPRTEIDYAEAIYKQLQ